MLLENLSMTSESIFLKSRFGALNSKGRYLIYFFFNRIFGAFKGTGLTKSILLGELVLKLEQKENLQKILLEQKIAK